MKCLRHTPHGAFLADGEGTEVLLPAKYVPEGLEVDQEIEVFCYLDGKERPVATTLKPLIQRNGFAYLKVVESHDFGAFADWGLEKHLFVPFREQLGRAEPGNTYLFHCYMDTQSFRLAGSMRYRRFTQPAEDNDLLNSKVEILPGRKTDLGWEAVVEQKYLGLLFFDRIFGEFDPLAPLEGYVSKIREDGKLDLDLRKQGYGHVEGIVQQVFDELMRNDGFLPLHDRTDPEHIQRVLGISKKSFKKAVGWLYKNRCIELTPDGIRLLKDQLPG